MFFLPANLFALDLVILCILS